MKAFTICALGVGFSVMSFAVEAKVKLNQLPAAVQAAMQSQTAGATILGASKEQEDGRMTYEVETKRDGKGRDLTFTESGALLEIEQEVDLDSIPKPAKQGIQKRLGGGTVKKVESVKQGSKISYEADIRMKSGQEREVKVGADGSAR